MLRLLSSNTTQQGRQQPDPTQHCDTWGPRHLARSASTDRSKRASTLVVLHFAHVLPDLSFKRETQAQRSVSSGGWGPRFWIIFMMASSCCRHMNAAVWCL